MPAMNKNELQQVLEILLTEMEKKKMLPQGVDKKALAEQVSEKLIESGAEIAKDELKNPAIQKSLCLSLMTQHAANKNPDITFDYTKLFKPYDNVNDINDLKKNMSDELKKVFSTLNELHPHPEDAKKIDKIAEEMAGKLEEKLLADKDELVPAKSKEFNDTLDLLSITLTSLFGNDPRFSGAPAPTFAPTALEIDVPNTANATDNSTMGKEKQKEYLDLTQPDAAGTKATTIMDDLMNGLADELQAINTYSPKSPFDGIHKGPGIDK